ncbi:unnamed protein product [Arctia plantaginis]|uniref:NF-kappa-B-repressing factor n=1 Tax=Arctia plantaginis TaxID=874455 RepID=A0A8S1AAR3_ARCPL|nr:unnamed protein product [Arctia plantaginis]
MNMSFDVDWDIDKYRDDHESDDHWQLRRAFMEKWKTDYPEDRLVCLARLFINVEILGCRYPTEVMQEIARLSHEVVQSYRKQKESKVQRTFVSASDAAEDRAKGIKRQGGVVVEDGPKAPKIQFVAASNDNEKDKSDSESDYDITDNEDTNIVETNETNTVENNETSTIERNDTSTIENNKVMLAEESILERKAESNMYIEEMSKINCLDVKSFREYMFKSIFGKMVLLIRPWAQKLWNIQTSCQVCNIELNTTYESRCFTLTINGQLIAQGMGESKVEARSLAENLAWERIRNEVISVVVKEQFIAQNDTRITVNDVSGKKLRDDMFGTPVENSVAMKMMQMMGWKGGGLGADAQGIAEPIKPNLQLVNRAGLGSTSSDIRQLRKAAYTLMERYIASDTLDLDLVFSSEFSKEERALLHQCAQRVGLSSRSYGTDKERFLVVKKKLDPFSLARAVIEKGGTTPKYQVFIPAKLASRNGCRF